MTGTVRVTLYNEYGWSPPPDLREFVAWANALLDGVPEEFRDSAEIDLESDESGAHISAWYDRPETAEEVEERTARARQRMDETNARERAMYEALKAKFRDSP